ncbi:MAG: glycosyltransferase family 2 protein [Bacteroidaceae bacterium]|nr:glycosyltransferase family 2 protein [Bacteroidaceae bacterium]
MKFSIILPVYKVEKYLHECIDSILNQSFCDFEVILVDDGSPDKCPQICEEYAKKDNRIKVIHKANGGQADARNVGLEAAKGEYICYIDSDDFLAHNGVLQLLAEKTKGNPEIVHYKFKERFESDGHIANCRFDYKVPTKGRSLADIYGDLIDKDAYYNSAWSKIIRRELLLENNIRFEKGIVGEDNEWYYHVIMVANSLVLVDEPLYVYRRRQGSTTTSTTRKNLLDQLYVLEKWEKILKNKGGDPRAKVVKGSLAKQYCSALIIYAGLRGVSDLYPQLKEKDYLLNYSKTKRVVTFRQAKKIVGLRGLIFGLMLIKKLH